MSVSLTSRCFFLVNNNNNNNNNNKYNNNNNMLEKSRSETKAMWIGRSHGKSLRTS